MRGDSKGSFESEAEYFVSKWGEERLLCLYPMCRSTAQEYLAVANQRGLSRRVREHFYWCARDAPYD